MTNDSGSQNLQGNHACALAAVAAGCRFYAGYPITPSSEIAERMATELPKVGGVFIQMEDEIGSMGAILGASMGGVKAMTATSGPGFSLKQENLGYGAMVEIPCVVINVMRGGPSTGMPTRPAQGDVMQARWGTHGDHPIIVLTPASVMEVYEQTIRAFNLAEALRTPVVVLYDETVGHLMETVDVPDPGSLKLVDRKWAEGGANAGEKFLPFKHTDDHVPVRSIRRCGFPIVARRRRALRQIRRGDARPSRMRSLTRPSTPCTCSGGAHNAASQRSCGRTTTWISASGSMRRRKGTICSAQKVSPSQCVARTATLRTAMSPPERLSYRWSALLG